MGGGISDLLLCHEILIYIIIFTCYVCAMCISFVELHVVDGEKMCLRLRSVVLVLCAFVQMLLCSMHVPVTIF